MKITSSSLWKMIAVLAILGVFLASYLLYSYLFQPSFQPCSINATINCDAVIKGEVSTFMGIPTSLYGLVGYLLILFASLKKQTKLVFGVALFGLLFCLRITFIEIFLLKVYCPVCLLCQIDMAILFIFSFVLLRRASSQKASL